MQIFKLITLFAAGAMALPTPSNVAVTNRRDIMQQVEARDIQAGSNNIIAKRSTEASKSLEKRGRIACLGCGKTFDSADDFNSQDHINSCKANA